jgi:hypothetical protein
MSYDLDTLIAQYRARMEDTVEPYLWSDAEILEYFEEAQDEFTQEVDVLNDEISIAYLMDDVWLAIPNYVTRIRDVETSEHKDVKLYNHEEWSEKIKTDDYGITTLATDWKAKTGPYPEALITDTDAGRARMYPIPTADGTLTLSVFRRPIEPLEDTEELEVTDRQHQRCLLLKARSLGYLKHDAEAFNEQLSQLYEQKFMAQMEEINSRVRRSRRRARSVAYGGL